MGTEAHKAMKLGIQKPPSHIPALWCRKFLPAAIACCLGVFTAQLTRADVLNIPLDRTNGWQFLSYRKIPPNQFDATQSGLKIGVTNSASPAVFPLGRPMLITELRATGSIVGSLKMPAGMQGQKGFDDYTVRIGLVESGKHTLNWREKLAAADWVKKLFALAPRGMGVSRIRFFNIGADSRQVGQSRIHPSSDLIEETVVATTDANGHFTFTRRFAQPLDVLAIWIASDGDDTKSSFQVTLQSLQLETKSAAITR
jgi:hypothetical protein